LSAGDILSLDSAGGRYGGYIGDLCRMGIVGRPDAELEDALGWAGNHSAGCENSHPPRMVGQEIFAAVQAVLPTSPLAANTHFVAHGMGSSGTRRPASVIAARSTTPAYDGNPPRAAGMCVRSKTTLMHPAAASSSSRRYRGGHRSGLGGATATSRGWNPVGVDTGVAEADTMLITVTRGVAPVGARPDPKPDIR